MRTGNYHTAPVGTVPGARCIRCGRYARVGEATIRRPTEVEVAVWDTSHSSSALRWVTEHARCRERYASTLVHWKHQPDPALTVLRQGAAKTAR